MTKTERQWKIIHRKKFQIDLKCFPLYLYIYIIVNNDLIQFRGNRTGLFSHYEQLLSLFHVA